MLLSIRPLACFQTRPHKAIVVWWKVEVTGLFNCYETWYQFVIKLIVIILAYLRSFNIWPFKKRKGVDCVVTVIDITSEFTSLKNNKNSEAVLTSTGEYGIISFNTSTGSFNFHVVVKMLKWSISIGWFFLLVCCLL